MDSFTVLLTNVFKPDHVSDLRATFPGVTFVQLPQSGAVPLEGRDARVLFRCYMSKPELRRCLEDAQTIEWIHTCSAGFDQLMIPEIIDLELLVTRSARSHSIPMGEFVIAFMFLVAKRLPQMIRSQAEQKWLPPDPEELGGKTVGIVGTGAVGTEVARRCDCLGMRVIGIKRTPEVLPYFEQVLPTTELPGVLQAADYVVLACPLTPETRGMIGEPQLRIMKNTAYLINVARGALIVEPDLVRALQGGWIAGACLDALVHEPLPSDSPLWSVENLIITPHCSYRSPHGMGRILEEFKANLGRYQRGEPLENRLRDPALGY